jgi:uncharacterized tellurite resistance protein B-like protein
MTPIENLYYAIGELAYSVARADGRVQKEEREKFHNILIGELGEKHSGIDISEIIFQLFDKRSSADSLTTYHWAIHEIRNNSHYLSPDMKKKFVSVMSKVAEVYPPVTPEEKKLIEQFKLDIAPLEGDPIYYTKP